MLKALHKCDQLTSLVEVGPLYVLSRMGGEQLLFIKRSTHKKLPNRAVSHSYTVELTALQYATNWIQHHSTPVYQM